MTTYCGIDLGTTYSAISFYDQFNNRVDTMNLDTADGLQTLPSVVYYPDGGEVPVVGDSALNAQKQHPDRVIVGIKRTMGTDFRTQPFDGREYTPQEVSAEILKTLARDAEPHLGEPARDVVITVPAYFGENERAATEEAGKLAGLNVLALLPEPHAAALAFAVQKAADMTDRYILVYDLGGGTYDVTLIHTTLASNPDSPTGLCINTLCKDGNAQLGGLDWTRNLAEITAEKIMQQYDMDMWADAQNEALLLESCEKAKRHLSRVESTQITVGIHGVVVTRSEFEERTASLLLQTEGLLDKVLEDAEAQHGITRDQIDILLAGGAISMPMVLNMVSQKMGKKPIRHGDPNLLVTIGAAYWAHLKTEGNTVDAPIPTSDGPKKGPIVVASGGITDVSTYAVGVETVRRDGEKGWTSYNSVIIESGTTYGENPVEKEFATAEANTTAIPIILYKGDSENIDECEKLVEFTLEHLPSDLPEGTRIRVSLGYNQNGILNGKATLVKTGQSIDIVYDRSKD